MRPVVIVPVNRLDRAKGRLADVLTPPQRSELALATLATVLAAVEGTDSRALILSADPAVRDAVAAPHEAADEDRAVSGLNQQLAAAIRVLDAPGVVILHGDLPLVTAGALKSVLDAAPAAPSVTLVESGDGGTNVMLLCPARIIALHYGRGSAALHRTAAASAGASVTTVEVPEIALDLDTPADIQRLLGSEQGRTSAAGRLLRSWGFVADGARSS